MMSPLFIFKKSIKAFGKSNLEMKEVAILLSFFCEVKFEIIVHEVWKDKQNFQIDTVISYQVEVH
jgi:hypothetical protein